jgi:hypothetical protein
MASGSKTDTVFTKNNLGEGKSTGIVDTKANHGQVIKSAYPQDNQHGMELSDERGGSVRGGPTNLSHSLSGASAVQDGPGAAGSVKHVRIPNH